MVDNIYFSSFIPKYLVLCSFGLFRKSSADVSGPLPSAGGQEFHCFVMTDKKHCYFVPFFFLPKNKPFHILYRGP